ncbi:hypothetical protein WMY93_006861 [Mugilogobius chulae]|uniref:TIR domain-containing protein n=1 Tax=Mugilogobius chulae TaxID=88201 RepID=A0AAW0PPS7_9GOBI
MRLQSLDLSQNQISHIDDFAFSHLSVLTKLVLKCNRLTHLTNDMFQGLSNLTVLNLEENNLRHISKFVFAPLRKLQTLSNSLTALAPDALQMLTHLSELSIGYNFQTRIPLTIRNMSSLTFLSLVYSDISRLYCEDFAGLRMLTDLLLSHNKLVELHSCAFRDLHNLKTLDVSSNLLLKFDDSFGLSLPSLLVFKADRNHLDELQKGIPNAAFFKPNTALQTLDLSENHLESLDFLLEANLTHLQKLILRNNDLSVINEKVFDALPSLKYLDLWHNPFACNCSNAGFIHWLIFNRQVYVDRAFQYKCASPTSHLGVFLLDFNVRWCWESTGFYCFVSSSALVLLTLLGCFAHRFLRVSLLYGFYLLRAFLYHRQRQRRGCAEVYDAFVSYNVHDEEWVYRELVPELEERQGWRLCLHHRDFQPVQLQCKVAHISSGGFQYRCSHRLCCRSRKIANSQGKAILENITDAIYSSRKTLCVISRQYLLSEWCSREIQMASFRLLDEKKDVLVLLFLEELSSNQLSSFFRMRKLLRRQTYVSWSRARGHRGLFWEKVRRALQSEVELPAEGLLPPDV